MKKQTEENQDGLKSLKEEYFRKQADKPVLEHPRHAELYHEKLVKQIRTSRANHEKAQKED
jgi:hypothetical protein